MRVAVDLGEVNDWEAFHRAFAMALGFPDFYGNNMNAWIDCMSYVDDPGAGMSRVVINEGEVLELEIRGTEKLAKSHPDIAAALLECTGFVNQRFIEAQSASRIAIIAT